LPKDYYFIVGYKDGKFDIKNNSVKRISTDNSFDSLEMSKDTYINNIKDKIKNKK